MVLLGPGSGGKQGAKEGQHTHLMHTHPALPAASQPATSQPAVLEPIPAHSPTLPPPTQPLPTCSKPNRHASALTLSLMMAASCRHRQRCGG